MSGLSQKHKICSKCIMDTTDPEIFFNEHGICNHCTEFETVTKRQWFPNEEGMVKLEKMIGIMRARGRGRDYDCILGLSGGIDSSYMALKAKDWGLRPLVVHVDAGWNSELAVYNIEQIVKYCGYDLYTHVMDWEEIRDLQLAYLKSGISNQDVVQDHAFFASLYHFAVKNNISTVISGGNIATESVFPRSWHHAAMDAINLKAIHKKFGSLKLKQYKTISFLAYFFYYPFLKGMTVIRPLNFMPYHKENAIQVLKDSTGYKEYARKHGESRFTKFFQNYYLPEKFNMDKRKPHLSSQVLSGEISREQALRELEKPLYKKSELKEDFAYISKKLGISLDELDQLVHSKGHDYSEYSNWDSRYSFMKIAHLFLKKIMRKNVKTYS